MLQCTKEGEVCDVFLCCYVIKYGSIVKIEKIKNTLVLCTTQNTEYYGGI